MAVNAGTVVMKIQGQANLEAWTEHCISLLKQDTGFELFLSIQQPDVIVMVLPPDCKKLFQSSVRFSDWGLLSSYSAVITLADSANKIQSLAHGVRIFTTLNLEILV